MTLEELRAELPATARDLSTNLSSLAADQVLTPMQKAGCFLAAALATKNQTLIAAVKETFAADLQPVEADAVEIAFALMGMNNVYYRFTHLVGGDYQQMPAKLRMTGIASQGADKTAFELWCLVVSAINGCGRCMESHEKTVRHGENGLTQEQVQTGVRIAAVVAAAGAVLSARGIV